MKKIILALSIFSVLLSCTTAKKEKIEFTNDTLCDAYNLINPNDYITRYLFLTIVKEKYCSGEMNKCILKNHNLDDQEYKNRVFNVWGNNPKPYKIAFSEIDKLIKDENNCLIKYIGFELKGNEITKLELVNYNILQKRRFSIPLFKSLKNEFSLVDTDIVEFITAKETASSDLDVMFQITRNNVRVGASYDVTIDPSFNIDFKYLDTFFKDYPNPYVLIP